MRWNRTSFNQYPWEMDSGLTMNSVRFRFIKELEEFQIYFGEV